MKPTTLFFSLIGAISAASFSAIPSFAQTTPVTVTGGNFSFNFTYGGLVNTVPFTSATALTPFGPVIVTNGSSTQVSIPSVGVTLRDKESSPPGTNVPSGLPAIGAFISASGNADGTISNQLFSNAPFSVNGNIQSRSINPTSANTGSGSVTASINTGFFDLPTSFVNSLSIPSEESLPISSIIRANEESARRIFNTQPVLESGNNFLPSSSLSSSRIHPDLFAK